MFENLLNILAPLETQTLKASEGVCGLLLRPEGTVTHSV